MLETQGKVSLERDGGTLNASLKAPLYEGDVVATGTASRALLGAASRQLELGENTRFRLGPTLTSLEVETGEIAFLGDEDGGWSDTSVVTPFGTARLGAGARARVRFVDGGLVADVTIGTIELEEPDGGVRTAKAGQQLEVGIGAIELEEPAEPVKPGPVTFSVLAGKPLIKKKGAAKFTPADKTQQLEPGGAWRVPAGGRAQLKAEGLVILLEPGASGVVDGVRKLGGVSATALSEAQGEAQVQLDGAPPAELSLGGLKLSGSSAASAALSPAGKKTRVDVRAGELELAVGDQKRTLKAGEAALVGSASIEDAPAVRAAVVVPLGKRARVYAEKAPAVALALPEEGAHLVEVATDADFKDVIVSGNAEKQVVVPGLAKGELFWRALDKDGKPVGQGRVRFGADTASRRDDTAKSDTVAETGLKATIFFQSKVPTLTFTFTAQPGAKSYRLRVYRAGELKTPLVERQVNEPKATVESGAFGEGSYLWSATPLDASGNESSGGRMNKLDVVYDNSLTSLSITSPRNGEKATAATTASGVAPLGSTLFVNGRAVKLDAGGRFSTPVGKVDTVVFRLVHEGGESFWVRRLAR